MGYNKQIAKLQPVCKQPIDGCNQLSVKNQLMFVNNKVTSLVIDAYFAMY